MYSNFSTVQSDQIMAPYSRTVQLHTVKKNFLDLKAYVNS